MNSANIVNIQKMSEMALEKALEAKLRQILAAVKWFHGWKISTEEQAKNSGFDIVANLSLPQGGEAALGVECKRELRPSAFQTLTDKALLLPGRRAMIVPVLAMPFVSPRVVELCAEHGWSWFDLAGNYLIDVPGLLHLHRTGQESICEQLRPTANLSTREAGRVLRVLLALENIGKRWTQRELKSHARPMVSIGLVNKIVRHLHDEAFIEELPNGGFRLLDPLKLLFAWRDAYRFDRHQRRNYFTLLDGMRMQEALAKLDSQSGGLAAYAAFSAADFQAPHVRQAKTWLYVNERNMTKFENLVQAKQVDSGENIVVLIPDDDGIFSLSDGGTARQRRLTCTNMIQTYVDLSHCGGRGAEAAEAILNQRLKPAWKEQRVR